MEREKNDQPIGDFQRAVAPIQTSPSSRIFGVCHLHLNARSRLTQREGKDLAERAAAFCMHEILRLRIERGDGD